MSQSKGNDQENDHWFLITDPYIVNAKYSIFLLKSQLRPWMLQPAEEIKVQAIIDRLSGLLASSFTWRILVRQSANDEGMR